ATDGALDLVEAQVEPDLRVDVLVEAAVVAEPARASGDLVVVGDEHAAVTHDREVLRRVEGERGRAAEASHPLAVPRRAVRLAAVLERPQAEARGELADGGHVDRLSVNVDG